MGLNPNQPSPNPVHSAIGPLGPVRPILPGGVFGGSSSTKLGPKIPRKAKITKQSHPENAQPPSIKRYMLKIAFQPLPKQSQIPFTYPAFMASTSMKYIAHVLEHPYVRPSLSRYRQIVVLFSLWADISLLRVLNKNPLSARLSNRRLADYKFS
jgi:hypothetical protein